VWGGEEEKCKVATKEKNRIERGCEKVNMKS